MLETTSTAALHSDQPCSRVGGLYLTMLLTGLDCSSFDYYAFRRPQFGQWRRHTTAIIELAFDLEMTLVKINI